MPSRDGALEIELVLGFKNSDRTLRLLLDALHALKVPGSHLNPAP